MEAYCNNEALFQKEITLNYAVDTLDGKNFDCRKKQQQIADNHQNKLLIEKAKYMLAQETRIKSCQIGNYDALRIPLDDPSIPSKVGARNICNLGAPYLLSILDFE